MNITLNKNSWHFKIYSKVFTNTPPKSLCPYFWSMVAILVFSPIYLIGALFSFLEMKLKRKPKPKKSIHDMTEDELIEENKRMKKEQRIGEITGKVVIGIFLLSLLGLLILASYLGIQRDGLYVFLRWVFFMIGIATSVYWFIRGLVYVIPKITVSNVYKVPVAMIKVVYTKTCPIIKWK